MSPLEYQERPAAGEPQGLLILHHGRGTDERDLLGLADALDPRRRLHVVTPRAPLELEGSPGFHWYLVPRVGYPDPASFAAAQEALAALHDELWARTGLAPAETVLGGFSMGCVMSYAMGLDRSRPRPAGILALSGFVPTVPGWEPDLAGRRGMPVLIGHGRRDPVIPVQFAREAARALQEGGLAVEYLESDAGHNIDPALLASATSWLAQTLPARAAP
ncbi:MAG: alpha/beta hydrolase [Solirubrobacteraceae bacterium]